MLIVVERDDGVLLQPATAVPVETYTPRRRAEFLLSNAVHAHDYQRAAEQVRGMGLDPASIPHERPPGVAPDEDGAASED